MSQVFITETVLRDAHQCLLATRMRTEDMLPICNKLDKVGYWALEMWGGATFDTCLRFLKEDPWQRLRQLRAALPNTQLSMLLRGQNILGYRHYADDVVERFIQLSAKNGIDLFRVFDALNDIRNLEKAIQVIKSINKHAQGAICYTISPVHDIHQYVKLAKEMRDLGCDSIAIKDMAGLLVPTVAVTLVKALQQAVDIPIHLHTHATAGVAALCLYESVKAGCVHIDTAISSLSEGASHTCTESMVIALQDTEYATNLSLALLAEIAQHFSMVRSKYHQFESRAAGIDPRVHLYQVPGGMISNLSNQLKEQNALDKLEQVHAEIPRVREELGYPPLVTPTSQVVGTQAVLNVLTGTRYKTITNEVKLYCQGKYGKPPAPINELVRKQAIGQAEVIDVRPADLLADELEERKNEIGALAKNDEDLLSYTLFPDVAREFLEQRENGTLVPEPLESLKQSQATLATEFLITLHGEQYHIDLTGMGHVQQMQRPYYLTVDGVPEEVLVEVLQNVDEASQQRSLSHSGRPKATQPGDVSVAMPSTIVAILVKEGDAVKTGDPVCVAEAMKMETEVLAPVSGIVEKLYIKKGDSVHPDETLMVIT